MAGIWQKIAIGLGLVGLCFFGVPISVEKSDTEVENLFQSYLVKFNKTYGENATEYKMRLKNFKTSLRLIEQLNAARTSNHSAIYGVTKFSDMAPEEFQNIHLQPKLFTRLKLGKTPHNHHHRMYHRNRGDSIQKRAVADSLPVKIDWREKSVVGAVRNQKDCGACWAFSTVETAESMYAIKTGVLQTLSVQELIDCAGNGNMGCAGGDTCSLLEWLVTKKIAIELEESYPLVLKAQKCSLKKGSKVGVHVANNFTCEYLVDSEDVMLKLLANHGPLVAAVNALNWQNYLGGIIQFHCDGAPEHINHAVQIVGYDRSGPVPYYILRNSWGEEFGDKGYLYIAVGGNICGLATEVSALDVL